MKLSQKYMLATLTLLAVALAVGIPWAAISLILTGGLVPNGAWSLAVILISAAMAAALQSWRAEIRERDEAGDGHC